MKHSTTGYQKVYFIKNKGKYLYIDWGMCDTIEGTEWVNDLEKASEFTEHEKSLLDTRGNVKKMFKGRWHGYEKVTKVSYRRKKYEKI